MYFKYTNIKQFWFKGSGCGSVGRAVASDTRDPQFEASHRQTFLEHLLTVNCIEKTQIAHF